MYIPYTALQLVFFFLVYCFLGWIIESSWVSFHTHKLTNRGFMRGPFIPIYGCGAMTLLLVGTPLKQWPVAVFFVGMIAASILEYFTGVAMEAIFKVRYWDYSNNPLNINGHICLGTSLCWGFLALAENYFIHKPVEKLSNLLTLKELKLITYAVSIYFIVDLTLSFKAALDLRDIIIKMEEAKDELRIMKKRLDVILAYVDASKDEFIEDKLEKAEDIADAIEERFRKIKAAMEETPEKISESFSEEFGNLKEKFMEKKATGFGFMGFKDFYKRGIFLGNPTLSSKKFKSTIETIKSYVNEKRK